MVMRRFGRNTFETDSAHKVSLRGQASA
jgi:hypothetical protein